MKKAVERAIQNARVRAEEHEMTVQANRAERIKRIAQRVRDNSRNPENDASFKEAYRRNVQAWQ